MGFNPARPENMQRTHVRLFYAERSFGGSLTGSSARNAYCASVSTQPSNGTATGSSVNV